MPRPKFSPEELKPTGKMYPGMAWRGVPDTPAFNRPITPLENFKLLFDGKKPYWFPVVGREKAEIQGFRPRINPDNVINRFVADGGPPIDYNAVGTVVRSSWFDLEWHFVEQVGGMTVDPKTTKILDIARWEDYVSIPDLDAMDWDSCAKQNVDYLKTDLLNQFSVWCGLWERLMALMDVVELCIAMCDEDKKPGLHRFFDQYSNFIIDYIGRVKDRCNIHSVVLFEDWAHKYGPFMAPDTAREMLLPYIQRIVNYVHSRGMYHQIHTCGNVELLLPVFFETGADIWVGQTDLNDVEAYAKKYKDQKFTFGVPAPAIGPEASESEMREAAQKFVEEYKDCRIAVSYTTLTPSGPKPLHPGLTDAIYEYSRIAYQNED